MIYMDSFKRYNLIREVLCVMFRGKSVSGLEKSRPLPAYCAAYVPDCYWIDLCNATPCGLCRKITTTSRGSQAWFFFPPDCIPSCWIAPGIYLFSHWGSCAAGNQSGNGLAFCRMTETVMLGSLWEAFYVLPYFRLPAATCWDVPPSLKIFFSCMLLSGLINTFKATMYLLRVSLTFSGTLQIRVPPTAELILKNEWPVTRPRNRSNRFQTKLSAT